MSGRILWRTNGRIPSAATSKSPLVSLKNFSLNFNRDFVLRNAEGEILAIPEKYLGWQRIENKARKVSAIC